MNRNMTIMTNPEIRKIKIEGEIWFSIEDICQMLTNSDGKSCWKTLQTRLAAEGCDINKYRVSLEITNKAGISSKIDCANTEGILRFIQSIPSKASSSVCNWLAQCGSEYFNKTGKSDSAISRSKNKQTDINLIFNMLGDAVVKEITKDKSYTNEADLNYATEVGLKIAGNAAKSLEKETRRKMIKSNKFLEGVSL